MALLPFKQGEVLCLANKVLAFEQMGLVDVEFDGLDLIGTDRKFKPTNTGLNRIVIAGPALVKYQFALTPTPP